MKIKGKLYNACTSTGFNVTWKEILRSDWSWEKVHVVLSSGERDDVYNSLRDLIR